MKIIKDGNFVFAFRIFLSFLGAGVISFSVLFFENKKIMYAFSLLGAVIGSLGAYSIQAAILGIKPFTNDPYGWRKAKESYKSSECSGDIEKNDSK